MIEQLIERLNEAKKSERHRNYEESRYWCDQYKMIAEDAIKALRDLQLATGRSK